MATFRKRSGSWQVLVRKKGFGQIGRTFDTKAEAETWAKITESEMVRGVYISRDEAENTTLSEALDRYIDEHTSKLKTAYREGNRARALKEDSLGKRSLAGIRGVDIADFIKRREAGGVGPKTIKLDLGLLSKLFNLCKTSWGMESLQNPVLFVQKPKLPSGRDHRFHPGGHPSLRGRNGDAPVGTGRDDLGPGGPQEADSDASGHEERRKADCPSLDGSLPDTVGPPQAARREGLGNVPGFYHPGVHPRSLPRPESL